MTVGRRSSSWWDVHVDQTKAAGGIIAAQQNGVSVANNSEVKQIVLVASNAESPSQRVIRNHRFRIRGWFLLKHRFSKIIYLFVWSPRPSIVSLHSVTKSASGEARKNVVPTRSSGVSSRFRARPSRTCFSIASGKFFSTGGGIVKPGAIVSTFIPKLRNSRARQRVRPMIPALAAT